MPDGSPQEFEARRGVASRLAGALSFVNLMWGGAIVGVTISVGPVVAIVCQPAFAVRPLMTLTAAPISCACFMLCAEDMTDLNANFDADRRNDNHMLGCACASVASSASSVSSVFDGLLLRHR